MQIFFFDLFDIFRYFFWYNNNIGSYISFYVYKKIFFYNDFREIIYGELELSICYF